MFNKLWESPDKIIQKEILEIGILGFKPSDYSICTIQVTDVNPQLNPEISEYLMDNITYQIDVIIGESNTAFDRQIDKCIMMMHQNEFSCVVIKLPENQISFNIKLCKFISRGYIYEWSASEKYSIAQKHKEQAIDLFKKNRFKDASHRFNRALKLILSIPIPVDEALTQIDGVQLEHLYKFHANLYNNLASCYTKQKLYDYVLMLCTKVLEIEPDDLKALYKRSCAYIQMNDFERAHKDLTKLLILDNDNRAAREKIQYVNIHLKREEEKFNLIVKKMFRT